MVANKNEGSQFSEKNVSNAHLINVCLALSNAHLINVCLAHVKEQSPGRVLACVFPLRSERLICYKIFCSSAALCREFSASSGKGLTLAGYLT